MPNKYFSFKKFTIQQEHCAMKVCTDACLFGAWVASKIDKDRSIENMLDVGTGTGLLSLMLAQNTTAHIDAVEINAAAALQAAENFNSSPWAKKLRVFISSIDAFESDKKYDCIISNPPFFEDDLKSSDSLKNDAKHDTTLTLDELLIHIKRLLKQDGRAAMLIPWHRTQYLEQLAIQQGFYIKEKLLVKQSVDHGFFRTQLLLSSSPCETNVEEMYIHNKERQYSAHFTALLKEYYLKL